MGDPLAVTRPGQHRLIRQMDELGHPPLKRPDQLIKPFARLRGNQDSPIFRISAPVYFIENPDIRLSRIVKPSKPFAALFNGGQNKPEVCRPGPRPRPAHAFPLDQVFRFPKSGGINQRNGNTRHLKAHLYGIAGRARFRLDNRHIPSREAIDET